jgi:hypothetical protein
VSLLWVFGDAASNDFFQINATVVAAVGFFWAWRRGKLAYVPEDSEIPKHLPAGRNAADFLT